MNHPCWNVARMGLSFLFNLLLHRMEKVSIWITLMFLVVFFFVSFLLSSNYIIFQIVNVFIQFLSVDLKKKWKYIYSIFRINIQWRVMASKSTEFSLKLTCIRQYAIFDFRHISFRFIFLRSSLHTTYKKPRVLFMRH